MNETMYSVQFSSDGSKFRTLQKFSDRNLAYSVCKACAGYGSEFNHRFWRVRKADQNSSDFHATISE